MEGSTRAPQHRLVHVRGGSQMLFSALCVSLPEKAQDVLSAFLWSVPFAIYLSVPVVTTASVQYPITSLFLTALAKVTENQQTPSQWKASFQESQVLTKVSQLALKYLHYYRLSKLTVGPLLWTRKSDLPADRVASLTDAAICECVVALVGKSVPARSPASQRELANPATVRVCASLFATTTRSAMKSYFHHILSRSRDTEVTIYIPGLLTAPWTTHLMPLLDHVVHQHMARVVGYDVYVDASRYEVNLEHLRKLVQLDRESRQRMQRSAAPLTTRSAQSSATNNNIEAASSSPTTLPAAATDAVLILASIRGRTAHNRDKAFEFAKRQGWQLVELCLPTLTPYATMTKYAYTAAQSTCDFSATTTAANLTISTQPDMRITAFDDAGMYGGAVVHLCVSDPQLIEYMTSECEVGLADASDTTTDVTAKSRTARAEGKKPCRSTGVPVLHGRPPTTLPTTSNLTVLTSEYLTQVWIPWTGRLYGALQEENLLSLRSFAKTQQRLAMLGRSLAEVLVRVPLTLRQGVANLVSSSCALHDSVCGLKKSRDDGTATEATTTDGEAGGYDISADTPVEQRTTVITQPMKPLNLVPVLTSAQQQQHRQNSPDRPQRSSRAFHESEGAMRLLLLSTISAGDDAPSNSGAALTSWMSHLPMFKKASRTLTTSAAHETHVNTPTEWRIRLRWTALLLSAYVQAITDSIPEPTQFLSTGVGAAAFVSFWSFVAELPPWVVAVSAENEAPQRFADHSGEIDCVEVAATALLVRVAYPASPRAVAQLLCDEAAVEARAVIARAWEKEVAISTTTSSPASAAAAPAPATTSARARTFQFEDALVMPGCTQAAALVEELLYIPLNLFMNAEVRKVMLRLLWEKVPHRHDAVDTPRRNNGTPVHVLETLRTLHRPYLSAVPAPVSQSTKGTKRETDEVKYSVLRLRSNGSATIKVFEDVDRTQQTIFSNAQSRIAAATAPPSFVTHPVTSLTAPVRNAVLQKPSSKL